jgi:hypothetical protein
LNSSHVQLIVNQPFHADGNDLLATWVLPPRWSPSGRYPLLVCIPGMSHSNNSKLFGDPSFLSTYYSALQKAGGKCIILVHFNCGGRTALGLHSGFETVLDEALRFGGKQLGARRDAIVLNGGSRGGYCALCWGARLSRLPGYHIRGIFASVFGIISAETSTPFELVASMATNYGIYGDDFGHWKTLLYETDGGDIRRRYMGTADLGEVERLGPLGAAAALVESAKASPVSIYLAYGTADPTSLNSSYHRTYAALANRRGVSLQADFYLGLGHEAGNAQRNQNAVGFIAALARGEHP